MRKGWIAALTLVLGAVGPALAAEHAGTPEADRIVTPGADAQDEAGTPRVLRGSALAPRPAEVPPLQPRFLALAGEILWVVDADSGDVVACRERDTFDVGKRAIRCTEGELP